MQVAKWRISLAVRLPAAIVKALQLKEGDDIAIHIANERVFEIEKSRPPKNYWQNFGNTEAACRKVSSLTASKPMKADSSFFDTNILLYLLYGNSDQVACIEAIVTKGGIISDLVPNEFASVA